MTYVSQREKIFALPDVAHVPHPCGTLDCTPPKPKRSDHRLKRFFSMADRRGWHTCEEVRYRYLYDVVSGSQTCVGDDQCHRYVPLEDLIAILMADKDAYIKELEERLRQCCRDGEKGKGEYANRMSTLAQELNNSRDMLRKAMHKLQNIDEIVNENKKLHCRLRCSEERVRYLEERKKHLENELADLRSKSQIQIDLEKAHQMLRQVSQRREEGTEVDEAVLDTLSSDRNELQEKVKKLEKELEESKKKESEIQLLKNQSQSGAINVEEISRENECFRKKLASMKCLEKEIQELKKRGRALADKYRRENQKAAEQMKKMCQTMKELQILRAERDCLNKRVDELASYECQYKALQRKLNRVDAVIAENEMLNSKLVALDRLESENEFLRCKLSQIQEIEIKAGDDKERIRQLQCAVDDQEEQMKDLLCQIEKLTDGRTEEEVERLRCELYEKESKLKLCEEQLAEIPMLEAELDELRMKLQNCCREFADQKTGEIGFQKVEMRYPSSTKGISASYKTQESQCSSILGIKREERVDLKDGASKCEEILQKNGGGSKLSRYEKKDTMTCEEVHCLLQSSKEIISCVLEDMVEHQKEMEELEMCNRAMKEEIENLKERVGTSDKDDLMREVNNSRRLLEEKDAEINRLRQGQDDEMDMETLKDLNQQMKTELERTCIALKDVAKLEKMLELEHAARCQAESSLRKMGVEVPQSSPSSDPQDTQGQSASPEGRGSSPKRGILSPQSPQELASSQGSRPRSNVYFQEPAQNRKDSDYDCCQALQKEIGDLKLQISELNKLTSELKKENALLRELQQPCPEFSKELDEKCALENLLSLLQAELDAFKGQKLSDECEALRNELKRVLEQNCQLKALLDCYRQRLDLEKKTNELTRLRGEVPPEEVLRRKETGEDSAGTPKSMRRAGEESSGILRDLTRSQALAEKERREKGLGRLDEEDELLREGVTPGKKSEAEEGISSGKQTLTGTPMKTPILIPSGGIIDDETTPITPKTIPSGREIYNESKPITPKTASSGQVIFDESKPVTPKITPSGRTEPEKSRTPTAPGGREPTEDLKTPKTTHNGRVITEGSKQPKTIPSGRVITEESIIPKNIPSARIVTDDSKPPKTTPSARAVTEETKPAQPPIPPPVEASSSPVATPAQAPPPPAPAQAPPPPAPAQAPPPPAPAQVPPPPAPAEAPAPPVPAPAKTPPLPAPAEAPAPPVPAPAQAAQPPTQPAPAPDKAADEPAKGTVDDKQLQAEINRLKNLLAEKEGALNDQKRHCEEMLKARDDELEKLRFDNNNMANSLRGAELAPAVAAPDKRAVDIDVETLLKQLEQLKQEKNELAQQLKLKEGAAPTVTDEADATLPDVTTLQNRIKHMEETVKKLIEQHAKELANRDKMYNDNIAGMKSGYETDIRKLAERHKASIMRLQGLHEDEVQELNTNYETQMESMQTQSEMAMNDVAQGSAAKIRKLSQEHEKQLKSIESEYENKIGGMNRKVARMDDAMEALRKKMMEDAERERAALKARFSAEKKKMRKGSLKEMEMLKNKCEDEKKTCEAELEALRKKLKELEGGEGICDCKLAKKSKKARDPFCPLDFEEVLEKILEEGLDSLSFNEIALVHRKTCCALEGMIMNSSVTPVLEPPVGDGCPHTPVLEADRQQLLKRIFVLENEIVRKQRQTQDAIVSMEVAIKKERCRLRELKYVLQNEQQKNAELKTLLSSQTKLQSDLKKERDQLDNAASIHQSLCVEKSRQLDQEKKDKKYLEEEVEKLKTKVKQLCMALDVVRGDSRNMQKRELQQVQVMRVKLEEAANKEHRLACQLENEAKYRMQLQCQLQALRRTCKQMVNLPSTGRDCGVPQSPLEAKSAKERQNLDQIRERKSKSKSKFAKKKK